MKPSAELYPNRASVPLLLFSYRTTVGLPIGLRSNALSRTCVMTDSMRRFCTGRALSDAPYKYVGQRLTKFKRTAEHI
jgi:hypothetical protein